MGPHAIGIGVDVVRPGRPRESATLAEKLIAATAAKQHISHGQLTIHADRGSSMTSKPVAFLLADLATLWGDDCDG